MQAKSPFFSPFKKTCIHVTACLAPRHSVPRHSASQRAWHRVTRTNSNAVGPTEHTEDGSCAEKRKREAPGGDVSLLLQGLSPVTHPVTLMMFTHFLLPYAGKGKGRIDQGTL